MKPPVPSFQPPFCANENVLFLSPVEESIEPQAEKVRTEREVGFFDAEEAKRSVTEDRNRVDELAACPIFGEEAAVAAAFVAL